MKTTISSFRFLAGAFVSFASLFAATSHAAPFNAAGHWVGADYTSGTWNNRHATFNDATPVALQGDINTTPTVGALINGHKSVSFDAFGDGNIQTGGAFAVVGSAAATAGGTNPSSGARGMTLTSVFATVGGVQGRTSVNSWQWSGLIGNEEPGGTRGDWALSYTGTQGSAFQASFSGTTSPGTFNNNIPHILTSNINSNGQIELWYDGSLQTTWSTTWYTSNPSNTTDTGNESGFHLGLNTGIPVGYALNNGDHAFAHGNMAEARVDSFAAPSSGASVNFNRAEVVALHNHLAGKYGTALITNEFYTGDDVAKGNYDNGIVGIVGIVGNTGIGIADSKISSSNDAWLTSLNSSGLTVTELGGTVGNGEGVFAGHNEFIDATVPATTLTTTGGFTRASRVWYVEETGAVDYSLTFDLSEMGITFSGAPKLLFAPNNSLGFTALALIPTLAAGDQYTFNMTSFAGLNGYFTLGVESAPEPSSMSALLMLGLAAFAKRRYAKRAASRA